VTMWTAGYDAKPSRRHVGGEGCSYRVLELGSDAFGIGVLAASFAAGTIVFAIPLCRLIARLGPQPVLVAGAAGVPVAVATILIVTQEWLLWVGCAMLGVTHLAIPSSRFCVALWGSGSFRFLAPGAPWR
jgi:hypothetical protein